MDVDGPTRPNRVFPSQISFASASLRLVHQHSLAAAMRSVRCHGKHPLLQQMPHFWWPWFAPRIFGASGFQISTVTELWWWSCDLHLGGSFSCPSFRGHVYFVQSGEKAWSGPGGIASSGDSWFSKIKFGKDNNQHDLAEDIDIDIIGYRGISGDHMFSRMRSKGSRFTLGVWGLRVCSLDVAFTSATVSQPSATVRNRSQPSATVRAIAIWPCLW